MRCNTFQTLALFTYLNVTGVLTEGCNGSTKIYSKSLESRLRVFLYSWTLLKTSAASRETSCLMQRTISKKVKCATLIYWSFGGVLISLPKAVSP